MNPKNVDVLIKQHESSLVWLDPESMWPKQNSNLVYTGSGLGPN